MNTVPWAASRPARLTYSYIGSAGPVGVRSDNTTPNISPAPLVNHGRSSQIRNQPLSRSTWPTDSDTGPVLTSGTTSATAGAGGRAVLCAIDVADVPTRVNASGRSANSGNSPANRLSAVTVQLTSRCRVSEN